MDEIAPILRGTLFASGQAKPCIVRMISGGEACIATYFPERLPDRFRLYLLSSELEVDCVVAWRGSKELGVRLVKAHGSVVTDHSNDRSHGLSEKLTA